MKDNFIQILKTSDENSRENIRRSRLTVSLILCIAASLMLVMNLKNHSMIMANASVILVVGFAISSFFAGVLKKSSISGIMIGLLVGFVLTIFAISGGNEGFAILWILLVPMFAISLLGIIPGLVVSTYFLIFLFVIFFTPIRESMMDKYTMSFITRFPILYLCDYAISNFFSLQKEYFHKKLQYQAYSDGMTGLYNRRYFMEKLHKLNKEEVYSIVMVDLNGLKIVNDEKGHEMGDDFICKVADICSQEFENTAKICRIGGDEIAIIAYDNPEKVEEKVVNIHKEARKYNDKLSYKLSFSTGIAHKKSGDEVSPEKIFKQADEKMYSNKVLYYQDKSHNRRRRDR